jgi:hypothetical protein
MPPSKTAIGAIPRPGGSEGGNDDWLDKQRLLLADMAVHLLQTAIKPGSLELDKLRDNLHAILTISDQFLPHAGLKAAREKLYLDRMLQADSGSEVRE